MPCPYNFKFGIAFRAPSGVDSIAQQGFHGLEQRLGFQHHAFAAAEWAVIDGTMAVVREGAQVVRAHIHETSLARPAHDPVIERTGKKFREYRDDLELHGRNSVTQQASAAVQIAQALRKGDVNALRFHVNVDAKFGGKRDQDFAFLRINRKQWRATWKFDVANGAKRRRCARFPNFASDEVADKVVSGVEPRALFDRHLNFQSAQAFRFFNTVNIRKMKNGLAAPAWR